MPTTYHYLLILLLMGAAPLPAQDFVQVAGRQFTLAGQPYYFIGTNFWYGMNIASKGEGGQRDRLLAELDHLKSLGVTNLRIMAGSEGPDDAPWRMSPSLQPAPGQYNPDVLDGLDFLLYEMGRRDMKAVVCLNNFWPWSGGFAQYYQWAKPKKAIPYPPPATGGAWLQYMTFSSRFYTNRKALNTFDAFVRMLVTRTNNYTGKLYRDDPAIMAWQLANEPRGMLRPRTYRRWLRQTAALIKSLDSNHLVSIGSEGNTPAPTGNHFVKDHDYADIDYTTIHIWVQNWMWYDPTNPDSTYDKALEKATRYLMAHLDAADKLGKPLVLEEFGMARDGDDHSPSAATTWRDRYYADVFAIVHREAAAGRAMAGCNFWAWAGQGQPRAPKTIWQRGDSFIGDPPHEYQGWYSVYAQDTSTAAVIRRYAGLMEGL